jgi:hypothetical protein
MSVLGGSAAAQDEKNELTGILGRVFISDQGIVGATYPNPFVRSGKGLTFEVNYARRLFATPIFAVSGEVPAVSTLTKISTPAPTLFLPITDRYLSPPRFA